VWHLLSNPQARYHDLGPDFYDLRIDKDRHARNLARQLQHITGQQIRITDGQLVVGQTTAA
jgi:transposase